MEIYLPVYFGSAFLSLMMTPVIIWVARRANIVDVPVARSLTVSAVQRGGFL